jgi:hypothetical protein
MKRNKKKYSKKINKKNCSKKINKKKYSKKINKKNYSRKRKIGGLLKNKCKAGLSEFPKCGKEGCVFLNDENKNIVSKKQWKKEQEIPNFLLSVEGQEDSKEYAPELFSSNIKPCNLISIKNSENKAPCIVKRSRNTRSGKKILYEEENRDSWCRNYGIENQCIVDQIMYDNLKNMKKPEINSEKNKNIKIPEIDHLLDGDIDSIVDEELGDLYGKVDIDESFTNANPLYLTNTEMSRIKGITIEELITEMFENFGPEKTISVSQDWEEEKEKIISEVNKLGYKSFDFNEQNIMIDVDDENLCDWIDEMIKKGELITPEKIKKQYHKENILKIVDWGLLQKV